MFAHFETYIKTHVSITDSEMEQLRAAATTRKLRKRQFLLQEGDICRHKAFISKGLLKCYQLKNNGTEYIMRFSPENTWMLEPESYYNQVPSKYYIEALENTELVLWHRDDFEVLTERIPALKSFSEKLRTDSFHASQERILTNISATSEEKYQEFTKLFPDVFRRVPLHMVASYLGVSRETLSRIRHAQLRQQR